MDPDLLQLICLLPRAFEDLPVITCANGSIMIHPIYIPWNIMDGMAPISDDHFQYRTGDVQLIPTP